MALDVARLGRRLKEMRERRELSISAVAEQAGLAKSYVAKLEGGEVDNPGLRTVTALAGALQTTLPELLEYAPPAGRDPRRREIGPSPAEEQALYESRLAEAPQSFRDFLAAEDAVGRGVPSNVASVLMTLEVRGKQPSDVEDWRFLYSALLRSVRRA